MTREIVNGYFTNALLSIDFVFELKNIEGKWKKT